MNMINRPVGVFDSGLGGLTVVRELMRQLPSEDIIYYGDTARVPYGTKSKEAIIRFSIENAKVLLGHDVKLIIVACNSSSSYALAALRAKFKVPILGVIHPGAQKAVAATRNRKVGIIATKATIKSGRYERAIRAGDPKVRVFSRPCPLFVPLAEEGWGGRAVARAVAAEYLAPLRKAKVDTLILGCTHYPLLKPTLQKVMGKGVALVDSACEVSVQARRLLERKRLARPQKHLAKQKFYVSDRPQEFEKIAKRFLGKKIKVVLYKS